jgi:transposase
MGDPRLAHPRTGTTEGSPWTSLEKPAICLKRCYVGVANRCPLGRPSGTVSVLSDLPSTLSTMGSLWSDEGSSGSPGPTSQSPWRSRRKRGFHRRKLCPSQKRGPKVGKTKRGKGTKIMAVSDSHGLPVAVYVDSATPHEVKLVVPTLLEMVIPEDTQNLVGDNAYDSDKLDSELSRYGIELISPHRSNRKNRTQDLRRLRRYRRRWKIERLFAWLQNFRRLVVRYERYAENFLGMLYLGCCIILLRHL